MHKWTPMLVFLRILNLLLIIIPSVPLAKSWRTFIRNRQAPEGSVLWQWLLAATTCSYLWLLLGLVWAPIIGGHFTLIVYVAYFNLAALAAIGLAGIFNKHPAKRPLLFSVCAVAVNWLWLLVAVTAV
jgi:hypothetical protein